MIGHFKLLVSKLILAQVLNLFLYSDNIVGPFLLYMELDYY